MDRSINANALSAPVILDGGQWTPTLSAPIGSTLTIGFQLDVQTDIEVRRDWKWDHEFGWTPLAGNCGVRFASAQNGCSIRTLEVAIAAAGIVQILSPHVAPTATINAEAMEGVDLVATFVPQRTLMTRVELGTLVALNLGGWAAVLTAKAGSTITLGFERTGGAELEVRAGQLWAPELGVWSSAPGNIGVRISALDGELAIAQLEAALDASGAVRVTSAHAAPASTIDMTAMDQRLAAGAF